MAYENVFQTRRGAIASEQGARESFYQARAAWIQTILLLMALIASVWAAVAASRAASAADETLEHTVNTAQRQLRAYLFPEITEVTDLFGPSHLSTTVKITNMGQTPAYGVHLATQLFMDEYGEPKNLLPLNFDGLGSKTDLGSTLYLTTQDAHPALTQIDASTIRLKQRTLYLYGEIRFTDAFDKDQTTTFRYFLHEFPGGSFGFQVHAAGNRSSRH